MIPGYFEHRPEGVSAPLAIHLVEPGRLGLSAWFSQSQRRSVSRRPSRNT
jgi:hypothetical protein